MISFRQKGDFSNATKYLSKLKKPSIDDILSAYGQEGIAALSSATPVNTGKTASSWYYRVEKDKNSSKINFYNSNVNDGVNIAIILQYGHATGNGGWVEGRDYINPAIQPVFDKIVNNAWREVTKL